jgi:hypothetical protein
MKSPNKLLQYQLFKLALEEENIFTENISIDHYLGTCTVNGIALNLKYPKSFVNRCILLDSEKKIDYCFVGAFVAKSNGIDRLQLLSKYQGLNSKIINTTAGRKKKNKAIFDKEYYQTISNSKFSLCPNHSGEVYRHENAWTYRLIESCFSKSIPILFKETPLGKNFIKDIFFLWNDEEHNVDNYCSIVENNFTKAVKYWTLQGDELEKIKGN